jgi:long-chain fatty acid transport protein
MDRVRFCVVVLLVMLLSVSVALGSGFQLNEHGTKAMGMGGAFSAQASDGSAMFFNPAGLAFQPGFRALIGVTPIIPSNKFSSSTIAETKMVSQVFFLPHVYASYCLDNGLAFGVSFFAPYGLGTEWPATWGGRYAAVKTDLKSFYINPTIAYKISDQFAVGVGFSYVFSDVKLARKVSLAALGRPDGDVALDANGHGIDFDAGILYKPTPELSIGASYRHSNKIDYEGTAVFSNTGALSPYFPGGTGKTTITFPNNIFAGIAYQATKELTLEADFQYILWSTYDTLTIGIPVGPTFPLAGRPLQGPSSAGKDWDNTYMIRVGGQYLIGGLALRAGVIYDRTPQPDKSLEPMLPDASRIEGTIGVGYEFVKGISVDVAYQYIIFQERTVTSPLNSFPGTYNSSANLFGLSLAYVP